jgi:SpoIID/LytB domain protein
MTLDGVTLAAPLAFTSTQPMRVNGVPYRGKLTVSGDGKTLQVIDTLGLDAYLKGVVAEEMPKQWPAGALQAQAVAARTYALANLQKKAPFDLYADGRSQVYGGVSAETPATDAAVDATMGQIVLWNGLPADALYSSTSGGRTASSTEVLGQSIPYLVPVTDPYDVLSPLHDWGPILVSGDAAAKAFKLPDGVEGLDAVNNADGRVKSLLATSPSSLQATVSGAQARFAFGLPSTWFSTAVLSLQPKAKTVPFGGTIALTGFLHGPGTLVLEAKAFGGTWLSAGAVPLDATGAFSITARPQLGTQYRLAWGSARVGLSKVAVSVLVSAAVAQGVVTGSITPAVSGAPVQLQQQTGTTWTTVASTTTDESGAWSFAQALQAGGTYRVRSAPGHGLAAGLSALIAP